MHFSAHIHVVKRHISVLGKWSYGVGILHDKHVLYCLLYCLVVVLGYYLIDRSLNARTLYVKQVTYF